MSRWSANPFDDAEAFWRASDYDGSGTLVDASGNGHHAQLGSTAGSDSNDPTFLDHDGTNYAWFPNNGADDRLETASISLPTTTKRMTWTVRASLSDLTPTGDPYLATVQTGANGWVMGFRVLASGYLGAYIRSSDASFDYPNTSTDTLAAAGLSVDTVYDFKMEVADIDTTTPDFDWYWKLPASSSWTQLGTTQSPTTAGGLNAVADEMTLGGDGAQVADESIPGKIYSASLVADGVTLASMESTDISPSRTALDLDGTGDYASTPFVEADWRLTELDVRARICSDGVPASADEWIVAAYENTDNQRLWSLHMDATTGYLVLTVSTNGTAFQARASTIGFPDGIAPRYVRATKSETASEVKFYTSPDGVTWSQMGDTVADSTAMSSTNYPDLVFIGRHQSGGELTGQVLEVDVRNLTTGEQTFHVDFTDQTPGAATVTASTGQTVTLVGDAAIVPDGQLRIHDSTPTHLDLPGASGDYASIPDSTANSIAGDIDVRFWGSAPDYTPATQQFFGSKFESTSKRSWYALLTTSGGITFVTSDTGTTSTDSATSTAALTLRYSNGEQFGVKITRDMDNGASGNDTKFYTKTITSLADLESDTGWTQLGTTVTVAGTTSIIDTTSPIEIGSIYLGTTNPWVGVMHGFVLKDGIDGTTVHSVDFTDLAPGVTSFTEDSSNAATVTLNGNAAIAGGSNKWDVNRATSGLVTTLVEEPVFVFDGVNDYFEVADHANLEMDTDYTVLISYREVFPGQANAYRLINKWDGSDGWILGRPAGAASIRFFGDGIEDLFSSPSADVVNHPLVVVGRADFTNDELEIGVNGVMTGSPAGSLTTEANAVPIRIGIDADSTSNPTPMAFTAAAVWRRALTDAEITFVTTLLQNNDTAWSMDLGDLSKGDIEKLASLAGVTTTSGGRVGKLNQIAGRSRADWTEYRSALIAAASAAGITWP